MKKRLFSVSVCILAVLVMVVLAAAGGQKETSGHAVRMSEETTVPGIFARTDSPADPAGEDAESRSGAEDAHRSDGSDVPGQSAASADPFVEAPAQRSVGQPTGSCTQENRTQSCTVVFTDMDGGEIERVGVDAGGSAVPPQAPVHDGFLFSRWDKSLETIRSDRTTQAVYNKVTGPTIAVDSVYIDAAQKTAVVNVSVLENPGVSSLFLNLSYDRHLTLRDIAFNSDFGEHITAPEPYASPQRISLCSPFEDNKTSGVLATLTFDIKDIDDLGVDKRLDLTLSCDQENTFNAEFQDVVFDLADGSITLY